VLWCTSIWAKPKPLVTGAVAIVGLIAVAAAAFVVPPGEWGRFDHPLVGAGRESKPLFVHRHWQLDDWSRAAVTLATLCVGFRVLRKPSARTLSLIALTTVLTGLALTFIACDLCIWCC